MWHVCVCGIVLEHDASFDFAVVFQSLAPSQLVEALCLFLGCNTLILFRITLSRSYGHVSTFFVVVKHFVNKP